MVYYFKLSTCKFSLKDLLTYLLTQLISFACESFNASTCHGSQWQAVIHFALSILYTRLECSAWVFALSSVIGNDASLFAGTLLVHFASKIFLDNWLRN